MSKGAHEDPLAVFRASRLASDVGQDGQDEEDDEDAAEDGPPVGLLLAVDVETPTAVMTPLAHRGAPFLLEGVQNRRVATASPPIMIRVDTEARDTKKAMQATRTNQTKDTRSSQPAP